MTPNKKYLPCFQALTKYSFYIKRPEISIQGDVLGQARVNTRRSIIMQKMKIDAAKVKRP